MLGVRLEEQLEARLAAVARDRGTTKSEIVRRALVRYLDEDAYLLECRRQSRAVAGDPQEEEIGDLMLAMMSLEDEP